MIDSSQDCPASSTASLFGRDRPLVGMVHVAALPGTPRHALPIAEIVRRAVEEAERLLEAGFDALIVENMHDAPYLARRVGPEIVAGMTAVTAAVRQRSDRPVGVQVLAAANRAALAVAHTAGARFIRAEGFAYAAVADEGLLARADAGPLLRYRRTIGAEEVRILADVRKKHSAHAITGDLSITDLVRGAAFCGADGIVITGAATGEPVCADELRAARAATELPLIVGSGATPDSVRELLDIADAIIVGSWCKADGRWENPIDPARARAMVEAAQVARR